MKALFTGIYNLFSAAPTTALNTAIGGRFYSHEAPQEAVYPYCIYNMVSDVPEFTFGGHYDLSIFRIQFSLYSQKSSSTEVLNAYENLKTLFDGCKLTVTGYSFVSCTRELAVFYRHPETNVWQHNTDYIITLAS
jgi:hypothetical protein